MNNSQYFQILFDSTRSLGFVKTQCDFSQLCGRKGSWFSSSKSVERPLSIGALITLATSLERIPADRIPRSKRRQSKELIRTIWLLVESRATTPVS